MAKKLIERLQNIRHHASLDKLKLYLESWVLPQLDEILAELQAERTKIKKQSSL